MTIIPIKSYFSYNSTFKTALTPLFLKKKFKVDILDNRTLPASFYYKPRSRFRADSIIRYQEKFGYTSYILGVMNNDISTTVHNVQDFGILGLSFRPGKTAVVSNYRLKDKNLFYKIAVHELLHCFGLPHCEQKDRTCYICDADKTPQPEKQTRLCEQCKKKLMKSKIIK